jgi:hypothetical protein
MTADSLREELVVVVVVVATTEVAVSRFTEVAGVAGLLAPAQPRRPIRAGSNSVMEKSSSTPFPPTPQFSVSVILKIQHTCPGV